MLEINNDKTPIQRIVLIVRCFETRWNKVYECILSLNIFQKIKQFFFFLAESSFLISYLFLTRYIWRFKPNLPLKLLLSRSHMSYILGSQDQSIFPQPLDSIRCSSLLHPTTNFLYYRLHDTAIAGVSSYLTDPSSSVCFGWFFLLSPNS